MRCEWCDSKQILISTDSVYWELPDGTRAIEITETPTIVCRECQISYQQDQVVKDIEDQLMLVNTKHVPNSITYESLMKLPRLLKRNYFDFYS